jgi:hypothetical protein
MSIKNVKSLLLRGVTAGCIAAFVCGCTKPVDTGNSVKRMPSGQQFAGFLKDYSKLQQHPAFENTLAYVSKDEQKNVHKYIAVIVDAPVVYLASDVDPKNLPDRGRTALADYFRVAITNAVEDAFPVVNEPGPLVLRLRTALIGVDVGPVAGQAKGEELERAVNIGKVGVEMELVDSQTGEQVAAAVDRQNLGDGATFATANFSREEKYRAAVHALDGWAARLRAFLDSAHELSPEESAKADESYRPYSGQEPAAGRPAK